MAVRDIVVLGGSAGSIEVLAEVVGGLPRDFPGSIFVVVHFPGSVTSTLPHILSRSGPLSARHPNDGETVQPGQIYVAPPGCHLLLTDGRIRLVRGPRENGHRPAVDPLFRSASLTYGPRVQGVILSGNLNDGTAGLLRIKQRGGVAMVQDPESALYQGMPRSALEHVSVDHVLPVNQIAGVVADLARRPAQSPEVIGVSQDPASDASAEEVAAADPDQQPGTPSTMTCPECHGLLWEAKDEVQYCCRVGHTYGAEALLVHQSEQLEAALWTALRALEEHSALARRLAARASSRGYQYSASSFTEQAMDAEHHVSVIRTVLNTGLRIESGEVATVS